MYASAALANGAYGTAKDNVTNHIAYYTIVGQFVCALRIGLQEAQTQHLNMYFMPLGGKAFRNDIQSIPHALADAIELLKQS